MGPEIIYVSGRTRAAGEMNGKSANLNNCLSQVYPAGVRIPAIELTCIFDADQARPARNPRPMARQWCNSLLVSCDGVSGTPKLARASS